MATIPSAKRRDLVSLAKRTALQIADDYPGVDPHRIESSAIDAMYHAIDDGTAANTVELVAIAKLRMRCAARDALRAERRRLKRLESIPEDACTLAEPSARMGADEFWEAATRGMSSDRRDAICLVYRHELTHAAAADVMGCNEDCVESLIRRSMPQLRRNLADHAA